MRLANILWAPGAPLLIADPVTEPAQEGEGRVAGLQISATSLTRGTMLEHISFATNRAQSIPASPYKHRIRSCTDPPPLAAREIKHSSGNAEILEQQPEKCSDWLH